MTGTMTGSMAGPGSPIFPAAAQDALPGTGLYHAGVDEVGIGPLAGHVVAAAVILHPSYTIEGLADSKTVSAKRRSDLVEEIKERSLAWAVAHASVAEIDELNILQASHLAMRRAVAALSSQAELILVDGNKTPAFGVPSIAVVKGDQRIPSISAASILAKVDRDNLMCRYAEEFPGYGLERHMGYPTKAHIEALTQLGVTPIHRRSFAPVRKALLDHKPIETAEVSASADLDGKQVVASV